MSVWPMELIRFGRIRSFGKRWPVVGSIGFVSFAYGKKMRRLPQMLVGFALMAYPYFVSNVLLMAGIAMAERRGRDRHGRNARPGSRSPEG